MKKFSLWLWLTVVFQLLTGAIHSVSLFVSPEPKTDSEKQLMDLMQSVHMADGSGYNPSFASMIFALSACFTLVYWLGGCLNLYLYKKKIPMNIMKGVMGINVILFGISFALMLVNTFLPPVICTGLVFISCLGAYFTAHER